MAHTAIIPVRGRSAKGAIPRFEKPRSPLFAIAAFVLFSCVALAGWPVDSLEFRSAPSGFPEGQKLLFAALAPLGQEYQTNYIHSVQLSLVEDTYRVQEGRIWAWQERFMSHNAGLPSLVPPRGRFISDPPWMIMEGGGQSWPEIAVRMGDEKFGKNQFRWSEQAWIPLWQQFAGQRLFFRVVSKPLHTFL